MEELLSELRWQDDMSTRRQVETAIFGTLLRQELKEARKQEPGHAKHQGTPRARGPKLKTVEEVVKVRPHKLPVGLQLAFF